MRFAVRAGVTLGVVLAVMITGLSVLASGSASLSLDGDWNFVTDPAGALKVGDLLGVPNARVARVPGSWQSQFADLRDYAGVAWYWRSVRLGALEPGRILLLRFGAVDYRAEVYVDGQKIGSHDGGYLPFEFDVTGFVRAGENVVAVRVVDPGLRPNDVEGIKYAEIPHGKQNWYVQTSGLWQSVGLDTEPQLRISTAHITAGADGSFTIHVSIAEAASGSPGAERAQVLADIRDAGDNVAWHEKKAVEAGQAQYGFSGRIPNPKLWSPDNPVLYHLHVELSSGSTSDSRFGFRTFEARNGKFMLNGKVIYLRGALDQAFYPETVYTPPSLEYLKDEMQKAKSLGLNLLRCHIKVPDPRYLEAADETGILVWYEIPNWDKLTDDSKRRGMDTLRGMVERDWNHPSIVIVSLINESWGVNLKESADRDWLKRDYHQAKALVPGWLVDDNSACCDNFHVATDLADFHEYDAIPGHAADFDRLVDDLARRSGWLFSPYGDAAPRGEEPLALSEFGNWGLPRLPQEQPWWFARSFGGRQITLPDGVERRFADYQYSSVFGSFSALVEATDLEQYQALKYEIETLRMHPEVQGYVITEFTDVNWEANGLLNMWRQPKTDPALFSNLQQDDLVVVRPAEWNYRTGEEAAADVYYSHFSDRSLAGASVIWELEGSPLKGNLTLPAISGGSGAKVGRIQFTVPPTTSPSRHILRVSVSSTTIISEDSVELFFYPPERPELPPPVLFDDPEGKLRRLVTEMRVRGYQPPSGGESFPVMIASTFDDKVKQTLQGGGRVILLATDHQVLAPGVEVVARAGSDLDGNWISAFPWFRNDQEPFKRLPSGKLASFETEAVTPPAVVRGVPPQNFRDVLAGIFYGWLHSNVGTLVQARYGKGKLLVCTFALATTYGSDPYATYFLDDLVNYAVSGFSPAFEIRGD
ncbi:MAG TPA: glycoside hydrolase family 2 TIM barrel-domain containing protein [Terriglobia bacterium]|nr:glycoside hydrolase family 2 TIM barrel-domain containing protein [Terriglobia bacterium]